MAKISTNIIRDGITLALRAEYPEAHIEADKVKQGLRPPAFIVRLVDSSQTARGPNRWRREPRFDIRYFPQAGEKDCLAVADELYRVLEVIDLPGGDKLRGVDMTHEVVDDVLHFLVSYKHFVYREADEPTMEDLELIQGGN